MGDKAGPYLSNAKQIREPFYSVDASFSAIIGHLAVYINILLDHERIRKCQTNLNRKCSSNTMLNMRRRYGYNLDILSGYSGDLIPVGTNL